MSFLMEQTTTYRLKPREEMLCSSEPHIWKLNEKGVRSTSYATFSLDDLFKDFFVGTSKNPPLIKLADIPKDRKAQLELILPNNIFNQIKQYKNDDGSLYISENANNSDYMWLFRPKGENKKIFTLIHKFFHLNGEKSFICDIQNHIVSILLDSLSFVEPLKINKLRAYLASVGDKTIVPRSESPCANEAFHSLLDNEEKIPIIIANFFISALLGLMTLNDAGQDKNFFKAYLLNSLGMEYIWTPELITTSYEKLHDIQKSYDFGEYKVAYQKSQEWLNEYSSQAKKEELAQAYWLIGSCIFNFPSECIEMGDSKEERDQAEIKNNGIKFFLDCIETGYAPTDVYYQLYKCFKYSEPEKALEYLDTAFEKDNVRAAIEYAELFLNGTDISKTENVILDRLTRVIDKPEKHQNIEIGKCFYLRGAIHQKNGRTNEAESDFIAAAQQGHEKAKQQISRKSRVSQTGMPFFVSEPERSECRQYCFTNSLSGNNLSILSTFPSNEWAVFSTEKETLNKMGIETIDSIDKFIKKINLSFGKSAIVLLMSEDKSKNLNDCLLLLDKLFNIALEENEDQKRKLIDLLDIFVETDCEAASMLIDASQSDMGDIYFKVHIKNTDKEAARQLLCDAPLFIPFLDKNKKEESSNIILLGSTIANYQIIKESIACAYMGKKYPVNITMLGKHADHYGAKLRQECPGLFQENHVSCIVPEFFQCDLSEFDFPSYIYGKTAANSSMDPIANALKSGNYFIVDLGDDLKSIQFATEIRTWLIRSRGTFDRAPFIAVRCSDARNAYLSDHLTVSGRSPGDTYYSRYNLFAFGMPKKMYSYQNMVENSRLEEMALRVHQFYCQNADEYQVKNDFYSYSYNSDSSICMAVGLSYRLFVAGLHFQTADDYKNGEILNPSKLYTAFTNKIDQILENAAAIEQSRWNGHLLSRGWLPASESEVEAYEEQSTGSAHKHQLAKLHPFIKEWDEIENEKIRKVLHILKSKFDYTKSPQALTRGIIRKTEWFVDPKS